MVPRKDRSERARRAANARWAKKSKRSATDSAEPALSPAAVEKSPKHAQLIDVLYRRYQKGVVYHVLSILKDIDLARETAQDAFEQFYRACSPEELANPRAMLYTIAGNLARMRLRRILLERKYFIPTGRADGQNVVIEMQESHFMLPDKAALNAQMGGHPSEALKCLHPNHRDIIVMIEGERMSCKQIARTLGISEKQIDKRVAQAYLACRKSLAERGIDRSAM